LQIEAAHEVCGLLQGLADAHQRQLRGGY